MLKSKIMILAASAAFIAIPSLTACVSTSVTDKSESSKEVQEANIIEVVDESSNVNKKEFIDSIKDISISFVNYPRYGSVGNDFVRPYTIIVTDGEGAPKADFPISIRYPSEKVDGEFVFSTENVVTDANGTYAFTAPKLTFSGFTDLVVYPTPISDNNDVIDAVKEKVAMMPWDVRSDLAAKGCVLVVWEYKENGRISGQSGAALQEIRSRGIWNAANAPMSDPSLLAGKTVNEIYKMNYDIEGVNRNGYMIYGTIKFAEPVTPVEGGQKCSLIGDIQVINMPDGAVKLTKQFTQEVVADSWWNAWDKCNKKLVSKVVESLIYDLN